MNKNVAVADGTILFIVDKFVTSRTARLTYGISRELYTSLQMPIIKAAANATLTSQDMIGFPTTMIRSSSRYFTLSILQTHNLAMH
jgi:hypothetical protein